MTSTVRKSDPTPPRYREIEEVLIERIRCGKLQPGDRLESTDTLAQELDAGVGTVNQALSALASRGLLTRRPRIGTVVSEGVSNIIGRAPASRSTSMAAVLVPDLRIPAYSGMIHHMQEILGQEHTHLSVLNIEGSPAVAVEAIDRCIDDGVDSLLLVPPLFDKIPMDTLIRLRDSGIPVVVAWRSVGIDDWPLVQGDPNGVITAPTRHLLSKGCKRIVMFKNQLVRDLGSRPPLEPMPVDCDPAAQLEFVRVMAERGMVVDPNDLVCVNHSIEAMHPGGLAKQGNVVDELAEWLADRPDVDGIVCMYDIVAALALEALARIGRSVPDDVAVTGGGSLHAYSWYFAASLTSMDPDLKSVAQRVCELFKRGREGHRFEPGHVECIPSRLIEGESTARKT